MVLAFVVLGSSLFAETARADDEFLCGTVAEPDTTSLLTKILTLSQKSLNVSSGPDTIRVRVIHVTFPETSLGPPSSGIPSTMDTDRSTTLGAKLSEILTQQSNGRYVLDFQNVLRLDAPDSLWVARQPVTFYQDPDPELALYYDIWSSYPDADRGDNEFTYEIFARVGQHYETHQSGPPYPFVHGESIVLILSQQDTGLPGGIVGRPWSQTEAGGFASVGLYHLSQPNVFTLLGMPSPSILGGVGNGQHHLRYIRVAWQDNWDVSKVSNIVWHELGHSFGLGHADDSDRVGGQGDPDSTRYGVESYMHGIYDAMRAVVLGNAVGLGAYSFGHFGLRRAPLRSDRDTGDIVPFHDPTTMYTTSPRRAVRLYDWRIPEAPLVAVPLDSVLFSALTAPAPGIDAIHVFDVEGFLLSYHSGIHEDQVYPSSGVAIWRYVNRSVIVDYSEGEDFYEPFVLAVEQRRQDDVLLDLESAWGRWATPYDDGSTVSKVGATADPENGYDNHDVWPGRNADNHKHRYFGDAEDFFSATTRREFSYRSNPSTFGTGISVSRRAPRDVPNSLFIEVLETGEDEIGPYVIVDILFAPHEEIFTPAAGDSVVIGTVTEVTWGDYRTYDRDGTTPVIDRVDLVLHRAESAVPDTIAAGIENVQSYAWTADATQLSTSARLEIVFHNTLSSTTAADTTGAFAIVSPTQFVDRSADVPLSLGFAAQEVFFFDADGDGDRDMFASRGDGEGVMMVNSHGAFFEELPSYAQREAFGLGELPNATRSGSVGDFDNDGKLDFFLAAGSTPRLYRNTSTSAITFEDRLTTFTTMKAAVDSSWTAVWFDYDRDGDLDLYVGRGAAGGSGLPTGTPLPDALFANNADGTFTNVTASSGIGAASSSVTTSAIAWADFDGNAEADLFLGQGRTLVTSHSVLLRQSVVAGASVFTDVTDSLPDVTLSYWNSVSGARWADLNNDGHLDLVIASRAVGSDASAIFWNAGSGSFSGKTNLDVDLALNAHAIEDVNLDGFLDIAAMPSGTSQAPVLWENQGGATPSFVNRAAQAGVDATSNEEVFTLHLADLAYRDTQIASDGEVELFVGRASSSGSYFFQNALSRSMDGSVRNWLGVRLASDNLQNRNGIGSVVKVVVPGGGSPDLTIVRQMGGESGATASDAGFLVFGLGAASNGAQVTVTWPDRSVTGPVNLSQSELDRVITIEDEHGPGTLSNFGVALIAVPPQGADWVISWVSEGICDPDLDQLTVERKKKKTRTCNEFGPITLNSATPGVTVEIFRAPDGKHHHMVTWSGYECELDCDIFVTFRSGTRHELSPETEPIKFTLPACVQ